MDRDLNESPAFVAFSILDQPFRLVIKLASSIEWKGQRQRYREGGRRMRRGKRMKVDCGLCNYRGTYRRKIGKLIARMIAKDPYESLTKV